jgi:hypothetical protein
LPQGPPPGRQRAQRADQSTHCFNDLLDLRRFEIARMRTRIGPSRQCEWAFWVARQPKIQAVARFLSNRAVFG